jgi:hypothetical protein
MIMFMSLSLILLALRLLIPHNWDLKSLILKTSLFFISVHTMMNKTNCTQEPWVYRSFPIMNKIMLLSYQGGLVYSEYVSGGGDLN